MCNEVGMSHEKLFLTYCLAQVLSGTGILKNVNGAWSVAIPISDFNAITNKPFATRELAAQAIIDHYHRVYADDPKLAKTVETELAGLRKVG